MVLNGKPIDSARSLYPPLLCKNITYLPMDVDPLSVNDQEVAALTASKVRSLEGLVSERDGICAIDTGLNARKLTDAGKSRVYASRDGQIHIPDPENFSIIQVTMK